MNELVIFIKRTEGQDDVRRPLLCGVRSIGSREFYQASATDYRPEIKLVLADYLDYQDESLVDYNGKRYRVLRTYRNGQALELTLERAPAEDGEANGYN